jgi:hypothetical protein
VDRQTAVQRLLNAGMAEKQASEVVALMVDLVSELNERSDARLERSMARFWDEHLKSSADLKISAETTKADLKAAVLEFEVRAEKSNSALLLAAEKSNSALLLAAEKSNSALIRDVGKTNAALLWSVVGYLTAIVIATAGLGAAIGHFFIK